MPATPCIVFRSPTIGGYCWVDTPFVMSIPTFACTKVYAFLYLGPSKNACIYILSLTSFSCVTLV